MVMTLSEVITAMDNQGLHYWEMLPSWMDQPLQQLLAMHGIQHVAQYMELKNMGNQAALVNAIRMANYLQLDNCTHINP